MVGGTGHTRELDGQRFAFDVFTLNIDHVQGDPFASPSRVHVRIPQRAERFPKHLFETRTREIALRDWLLRSLDRRVEEDGDSGRGHEARGHARTGDAGAQRGACRRGVGGSTVPSATAGSREAGFGSGGGGYPCETVAHSGACVPALRKNRR